MGDLLSLHRGRREPGILKDAEKTHDGRNHGDKPEVLRQEQPGERHDVCQIEEELDPLRGHSDQPAGDCALPEVRQQMLRRKVFFGTTRCRRPCRRNGARHLVFHRIRDINRHHDTFNTR